MILPLSLELPFEPVAAVRPKVTRWNTYYPGAYGKWLPEVREWASDNWSDDPVEYPVSVSLLFVVSRPKSHFGTGRNAKTVKASAPAFPHQDIDNFVKGALDALTGCVYADDRQVIELQARKVYGSPGRIVFKAKRADQAADPPALTR
jgi:Holliday junction resolvase RusA-like endonuclease